MELRIASNDKRFFAYLIDIIPILLILFLVFYYFFDFDETLGVYLQDNKDIEKRRQFIKERNVMRNLALVIWVFYGTLMDCTRFRGTLGKYLMKIKVADREGNPISPDRSFKRNFSKVLSVLPLFIGVIWILFDKRHQGWHDKIAGTLLIE